MCFFIYISLEINVPIGFVQLQLSIVLAEE